MEDVLAHGIISHLLPFQVYLIPPLPFWEWLPVGLFVSLFFDLEFKPLQLVLQSLIPRMGLPGICFQEFISLACSDIFTPNQQTSAKIRAHGKNSKNLAEQPQKWLFQKKNRKKKNKNGFLRFGAPIKCQKPKTDFWASVHLKKTQKHKKAWICVFALQKCPKTPENWIFPCTCPDTPTQEKVFALSRLKKHQKQPKTGIFTFLHQPSNKKNKNLTLSLQTSRNTKTWILMLSPRLQPHKTRNKKNYKSLAEQLQTWLRKKPERQTKNGFLPFLCPENARNAFSVRNSKRNWILWFCPANMPRNTQKPGIFLAFAKTHPKHFWHFHDQKKKHQKHPNSKLITFLHPKAAEQQKEKEINVVASKIQKHQDMDTHVFAAFAATKKHQTHQEVDCGVFAQMEHHAHPKSRFVCVLRSLCTRNTPKLFLFCFFSLKVTEHAKTVSVIARPWLENFLMSDLQGPSADGSRHAAQV